MSARVRVHVPRQSRNTMQCDTARHRTRQKRRDGMVGMAVGAACCYRGGRWLQPWVYGLQLPRWPLAAAVGLWATATEMAVAVHIAECAAEAAEGLQWHQ